MPLHVATADLRLDKEISEVAGEGKYQQKVVSSLPIKDESGVQDRTAPIETRIVGEDAAFS